MEIRNKIFTLAIQLLGVTSLHYHSFQDDIPRENLNPDTWVAVPSAVGNDETWVCSACTR